MFLKDFSGLSIYNMVAVSSLKWFLPLLIFFLYFFFFIDHMKNRSIASTEVTVKPVSFVIIKNRKISQSCSLCSYILTPQAKDLTTHFHPRCISRVSPMELTMKLRES